MEQKCVTENDQTIFAKEVVVTSIIDQLKEFKLTFQLEVLQEIKQYCLDQHCRRFEQMKEKAYQKFRCEQVQMLHQIKSAENEEEEYNKLKKIFSNLGI